MLSRVFLFSKIVLIFCKFIFIEIRHIINKLIKPLLIRGDNMPEPETMLKQKIRESGLTVLRIANTIKIPYGTLNAQLNGFCPLPYQTRRVIQKMITENGVGL